MTKGRSVGASVVLGFQDIDGMYEAFGENQAKSILGQCATKVVLRLDSPETAKWAESVFGEYEAIEVKQSATEGESLTSGESVTKGTTTTEGTTSSSTRGSSASSGSGASSTSSRSKTTGTSNSTAESESIANSTSNASNKSATLAAEITKRHLLLASQFLSLPMTRGETGIHGFLAHYCGAARIVTANFASWLAPLDPHCPRIEPRPSQQQYLRAWTPEEFKLKAGIKEDTKMSVPLPARPKLDRAVAATPEENASFADRLKKFRGGKQR